MSYNPDNPFARILRDELPCVKVYEDRFTLAIMDIMPQAPGHVLVITKEPAVELFDLSEEGAASCMRTTKKVAAAVKTAMNAPGLIVAQYNGSTAGQTVAHVHFHILPRYEGQSLGVHAAVSADTGELREIASRIAAAMS